MATDATKVMLAVTGGIFKGLTTATAPTGTSGAPTGFTDLGFISEDGVDVELPGAGDSTPLRSWQNNTIVRVIRTPSEDSPTWHFTMLEQKLETVELYFGVTVAQTATEGSFAFSVVNRPYNSFVIDAIDGSELLRDYVPFGVVTDVAAHKLANGEPIGYEVTITAERDAVKGYNFKRWETRLKL